MLIVTADDYGMTRCATDRILECYQNHRITSASGMVFMEDSERAAALALDTNLEIGLHLNLSQKFSAEGVASDLHRRQERVSDYLNSNRYAQALPRLRLTGDFRELFERQWEEFLALYGRPPAFVNGHHHMHLAANVLLQGLMPAQTRIRAPFTFRSGEKGLLNRVYRGLLTRHVRRRFISPECLYSIQPISDIERIEWIVEEGATKDVELEVHPEDPEERTFLLGSCFQAILEGVELGGFGQLTTRK